VKTVITTQLGDLLGFPSAHRELRREAREEDGAGVEPARRGALRRGAAEGAACRSPSRRSATATRLPAVHRRHHRRLQGRHAHARQHRLEPAADGVLVGPVAARRREIIITALPLYHIFALTGIASFMKIGAHNILITNRATCRVS
jgi:long-chain acyl-CoA synthetase